jgi:hypothetical protein
MLDPIILGLAAMSDPRYLGMTNMPDLRNNKQKGQLYTLVVRREKRKNKH